MCPYHQTLTHQPSRDPNAPLAPPDAQATRIEDAYMSSAVGALSSLSLGTGAMPPRPGHGTMGKKINVYANYFRINVPKDLSLTRYNVEVMPEVTGKKLGRIFQLLLELPDFQGMATEWRSMIISTKPLKISTPYEFQIPYRAEGQDEPLERAITYSVRVITPLTFSVSNLVNFLASPTPGPGYAQKAEIIQVMNAVFGNHANANPNVCSIGQNRHFSIDHSERNRHNVKELGGGLEALRGYFQSVRPATGGLLLNVNVTHGVFLQPEPLSSLFPRLGTGNKTTLQKKMKLVRVRVTHLPAKKSKTGLEIARVKTIFGLARPGEGRGEDHPPQVPVPGAGPKEVKFWLNADQPPAAAGAAAPAGKAKGQKKVTAGPSKLPTGTYISVFDYFKSSELS
jgi:eukaryotic translation initiation factor 2C